MVRRPERWPCCAAPTPAWSRSGPHGRVIAGLAITPVRGSGEPERVPRPVRLVRAYHGYGPQSADGLYCAERSVVSVSPELRADNSRARLSAVVALTVMAVAPWLWELPHYDCRAGRAGVALSCWRPGSRRSTRW